MFKRRFITQFSAITLLGVLLYGTPNVAKGLWQDRGQGIRRPTETKLEQRVALVIGNADYKEAKLTNPVNDARDMAAALRGVGFEVINGEDRNQRQMKELIRQFGQKLRAGGVGVFYFAGHGVQVAGKNYLIPVGAEINSEAEVEYEAIELGFVLAQLEEARNRLNVVILDACRNNPYARSFRSGSRGLAGVRNAPSGTLIAYATAADDVASDGGGRNGLYTGELLAQIKKPGVTLSQVFQRTRTSVRSKSQGKQVPYEYTSVEGDEDFYFIPPNAPPPTISAEQQAWERVKQLRSLETVRGFLSLYPNSPFEKEAFDLLAALEKENPQSNKAQKRIEMKIRLNDQISTITNKEGDKFTVVVLDPFAYADAVIEGDIEQMVKTEDSAPGLFVLRFNRIHLKNGSSFGLSSGSFVEKIYAGSKVTFSDDKGRKISTSNGPLPISIENGRIQVKTRMNISLEPGTEMLIRLHLRD